MTPKTARIRQDDTHRLVSAPVSEEGVLSRIADSDAQLEDLIELEGCTNDRLLGEANLLPGISVHELLFGLEYAQVVNAAFTHAHPLGSRFNGPERGAWYAAFELETAMAEIMFHKTGELTEIGWPEPETFAFDDYLADFRAEFHDLRSGAAKPYLAKDSYLRSQQLAADLLAAGSAGLVYPSVRQPGGTCLVCFRPALVTNVRKAKPVKLTIEGKTPARGPRKPNR